MTERIDHEAEAMGSANLTPEQKVNLAFETADAINICMAIDELKHATLALVEQKRIENLIALAQHGLSQAITVQAREALMDPNREVAVLGPNIAAALGIKEEA